MLKFGHLNKQQHDNVYPIVEDKQGGSFCNICGAEPKSLEANGRDPKLIIDRIDNEKGYYNQDKYTGKLTVRLDNLQLACRSCNNTKDRNKPKVEDRKMTPEMVVNRRAEPFFRKWVHGRIEEDGKLEYDEAVNAGAEFIEISTETTKNYLKKMISSAGDYEIGWGQGGGTFIYEKGTAPRDSARL
jgi:hypothetical protein|tara:strand:- start:834 stop:1391 length:558 start_codon:yes stop_codon:yes gene_type:complete